MLVQGFSSRFWFDHIFFSQQFEVWCSNDYPIWSGTHSMSCLCSMELSIFDWTQFFFQLLLQHCSEWHRRPTSTHPNCATDAKAIVASNLQPQSSIRINIFICCSHSVDWRLAIAFPIALLDRINHTLVCVVRPTIRTTLQPDTLRASSAVANAPSEWKTWIDRNCGATGMQACAFHMYILHDLIVHWRCQFTLPYTIYYYESTNSVSSKYICKWMNNNNKYKKKVATTHRDARWICMNEQKSDTHTQGDCFIIGVAPALEVNFKRYNISSGQKKKRSNHLANNERHMKNGGKS